MNISVPTNINDITLEQYQKFSKVNTGDGVDQEFFIHKVIEIFCGVDILTVSKFPLKDATDISNEVLELINRETPFQDRFTLDGVDYGFLPDLQAMTLGEYIDLEDSLKDIQEFHKCAAVMYRPIKKSLKEVSQDFSQSQLNKMKTTVEKDNLERNTDGSIPYMRYAEVIRQNLDLLQN